MATGPEKLLVQQIQQLVRKGNLDGLSDGELLREFVTQNDTAALDRLITSLSPMVWGVSRRLVRDGHDAEDVFQTTFLVLMRKARTIVKHQAVGSWVYQVAYHAATKARARAARRRAQETRLTEMSGAEPSPESDLAEVSAVLDREINQLSEKLRQVITLCCIQGKSNEQAARELSCPAGTVAVRLSRARELLWARLARCGFTLSAAHLASVLAPEVLAAAVPTPLLRSTARAAVDGTAGAGFSSSVQALGDEVARQFVVRKLKLGAVYLAGLMTVAGSGWLAYQGLAVRSSTNTADRLAAAPSPMKPPTPPPPVAVRSGPEVGQSLRGRVLPALHLNGPGKGGRACLIGKYGTKPVVLIFARDLNAPLQHLLQKLDGACAAHPDPSLQSFVVFDEAVQGRLEEWLAMTPLQHLVVTVGRPAVFREYAISEPAEVTVVFYTNSKVMVNYAYGKGQLSDADSERILKDLPKVLP
jgi:RNA polymerase sigma factor (sigma-70 family)